MTKEYQTQVAIIIEKARLELNETDFINELLGIQAGITSIFAIKMLKNNLSVTKNIVKAEVRDQYLLDELQKVAGD